MVRTTSRLSARAIATLKKPGRHADGGASTLPPPETDHGAGGCFSFAGKKPAGRVPASSGRWVLVVPGALAWRGPENSPPTPRLTWEQGAGDRFSRGRPDREGTRCSES